MSFTILLAAAGTVIFPALAAFNNIFGLSRQVKKAWTDIVMVLQNRYNLVNQLIEITKKALPSATASVTALTTARLTTMSSGSTPTACSAIQGQTELELLAALKAFFATNGAAPELMASQDYVQVQQYLTVNENKLVAQARFYNTNANALNTALQTFPENLIAPLFGFKSVYLFDFGVGSMPDPGVAPRSTGPANPFSTPQ